MLSDGKILSKDDLSQVARLSDSTQGAFFNSCDSSSLASSLVCAGLPWAVAANVALEDDRAWQMPLSFYKAMANGHAKDPFGAYAQAATGDGEYSMQVAPKLLEDMYTGYAKLRRQPNDAIVIGRKSAVFIMVVLGMVNILTILLINYLQGS